MESHLGGRYIALWSESLRISITQPPAKEREEIDPSENEQLDFNPVSIWGKPENYFSASNGFLLSNLPLVLALKDLLPYKMSYFSQSAA